MILKRINIFFILCIFIFKCNVLLSYGKFDFFNINYKYEVNINNRYYYDINVFKLPNLMHVAREISWESLSNMMEFEKYNVYFCKKEDGALINDKHRIVSFYLYGDNIYGDNYAFYKKRVLTKDRVVRIPSCFAGENGFIEYYKSDNNNNDHNDDKDDKDISFKPTNIHIFENSMINVISDVKENVDIDGIYMHGIDKYLTLYELCCLKKGDDISKVDKLLGDPEFIIQTKTCMSYCYYYYLKLENEPVVFRRLIIDFDDDKIISNINYIF